MTADLPSCSESPRTLLFAAGELPEAEGPAASAHARSCPACRRLLQDHEDVERAYARVDEPRLGPGEADLILQRVFAAASPHPSGVHARRRSWTRGWRWVAGLATAAGVALAGGSVLRLALTESQAPPLPETSTAQASSPFARFAALQDVIGAAGPGEVEARLLDAFQAESSPNVRLAILDALRDAVSVGDARVLSLITDEPVAPLRSDLLALAARHRLPGTAAVARRLADTDASGSVRARAASILEEM